MHKSADLGKDVRVFVAPPEYYPGNAGTYILQGPTKEEVHDRLKVLEKASYDMGMHDFEVVDDRPDPNGGWKCMVLTHNFNPVTWASEVVHRTELGAKGGWEQGKKKAAIKHKLGAKTELALAPHEELLAQKRHVARLAGKHAAIDAATKVHVEGEAALAAARERAKYEAALAAVPASPPPVPQAPIDQRVDMTTEIFS